MIADKSQAIAFVAQVGQDYANGLPPSARQSVIFQLNVALKLIQRDDPTTDRISHPDRT